MHGQHVRVSNDPRGTHLGLPARAVGRHDKVATVSGWQGGSR